MTPCLKYAPMLGAKPGELAQAEESALHAHLAGCDACQGRLADAQVIGDLLTTSRRDSANSVDFSTFADGVMARVEVKRARRPGFFATLMRPMAVLAPALAAAVFLVYLGQRPSIHTTSLARAGEVEVVSEGHDTMVLNTEDGPIVLLSEVEET